MFELVEAQLAAPPCFDRLTSQVATDDSGARVHFGPETVFWTVNGGYIAAAAMRLAARQAASATRPGTLDVHFLRPIQPGWADAKVVRQMATGAGEFLTVTFSQGGKLCAQIGVWYLANGEGFDHVGARIPLVARPQELRSMEEVMAVGEPALPPCFAAFEQRPIARQWATAHGAPRVLRWFRCRQPMDTSDAPLSLSRALFMMDVMGLPAVAQLHPAPFAPAPAPTIRLFSQFCDVRYTGEWLLVDVTCDFAQAGVFATRARVWGEEGQLVADGLTQMVSKTSRPRAS